MKNHHLLSICALLLCGCDKPELPVYQFTGQINQSSVAEFVSTASKYKIDTVYLSSGGGNLKYAMIAADTISDDNMDTVVGETSVCSSACTYLFIAGKQRTLYGLLGIHSPSYNGIGYKDTVGKQRKFLDNWKIKLKMFVIAKGVSGDFIERGYTIPSSTIKYLNDKQFKEYLIERK